MRYARQIPPEFLRLDDFAFEQLSHGDGWGGSKPFINPMNVRDVIEKVNTLDNETLERSRYYGLGLIMCSMAQALREPKVREHYVDWAGRLVGDNFMAARFESELRPSAKPDLKSGRLDMKLRLNDIGSGMLGGFNEAAASTSDYRQSTLVFINSLEYVARRRRYDMLDGLHDVENSSNGIRSRASRHQPYNPEAIELKEIINGAMAAKSVGGNFASATLAVIKAGLMRKRQSAFLRGEKVSPRELINPMADANEIAGLQIGAIAARAASLHLYELNGSFDANGRNYFVTEDETGRLTYRKDFRPAPAIHDDEAPILHNQTLKCPALHVPGMLRLVQGLIPEVVASSKNYIGLLAQGWQIDSVYRDEL